MEKSSFSTPILRHLLYFHLLIIIPLTFYYGEQLLLLLFNLSKETASFNPKKCFEDIHFLFLQYQVFYSCKKMSEEGKGMSEN